MQRELTITAEENGQRVDRVLLSRFEQLSRRQLARLFETRSVWSNGHPVAKGDAVRTGDVLTLELPSHAGATPDPQLALEISLETEQLVVVNKAAGVPSAPLHADEIGCVANALVARYPEMQGFGHQPLEAGLVHRLDNDTSGLLLAARTASAFEELAAGLKAGRLEKKYLAVVEKPPEQAGTDHQPNRFVVRSYVGPHATHPRRVHCSDEAFTGARLAELSLTPVRMTAAACLLEVGVRAAYRHQIRAQLAHVGLPLLGDLLYGGRAVNGLSRHSLHASYLRWLGTSTLPAFELSSALPADLARLL